LRVLYKSKNNATVEFSFSKQKGVIMNAKTLLKLYLIVSGGVFLLVGIFHLFRLIYQWPIIVGSITIPFLLSYAGLPEAVVASVLAFWLVRKGVK
jgi:hypothetical protein